MTTIKCYLLSRTLMLCVWLGAYANWLSPRIAERLKRERARERERVRRS